MIDTPDPQQNFDALTGGRIVDIHVWAVREGLCGTEPATLFMGLCRLVDTGVPVWRAFAGTRTLHPQWEHTHTRARVRRPKCGRGQQRLSRPVFRRGKRTPLEG